MKQNKRLRVGVVGYCPPTKFDENKARDLINNAYDKVTNDFPNYQITIVAGIINVGVLKLAYEEAKKRNWRTTGVGCKKAYDFEWFPVDEKPIIIGENWGDESPTFIKSIDALVRIGNGPQSLEESRKIKSLGKPVYEYELEKL